MDLEKYFDIYDINDGDTAEAMSSASDIEAEEAESVRGLKLTAARFYTTRKVFLCCLMALDAHGGKPDFARWSTAVDEVRGVAVVTSNAEERLQSILSEAESKRSSSVSGQSLMFFRFPCSPNSKNSLNTWSGAMASSAAQTQFAFVRYSRSSSKITPTSGRI